MTLQNLLAIRRLQTHRVDPAALLKFLEAARRNLADSHIDVVSDENRFDAAYKCIMLCAMLGLWVHGYRTATSQPGHHQTAIQSLVLTMDVPQADVIVLDALRRQRNVSDYEGDPVTAAARAACIEQAMRLLVRTASLLERRLER